MRSVLEKIDFYLLIPFFNNLSGLLHSLESVQYDAERFVVVIVDDGSDEPISSKTLHQHISPAMQVKVIRLPENKGITTALNTGLQWILQQNNAAFIARLDCGDICTNDRFYKQVSFLEQHPSVNLVGSWCIFKDYTSNVAYRYVTPTDHRHISRSMHFRNLFIHPTVIWRCEAMKKVAEYPDSYPDAEDYGFFYQLLDEGECAIIPEYLVTCEINHKGISISSRRKQLKSRIKVVKEFGKNKVLRILGVLKLRLLLIIPYNVVFAIKRALYGV